MSLRRRAALATATVVLGVALALVLPSSFDGHGMVRAATPSPTPALAGDPRSSGEGAGLVGSPFLAIGGVLAVGLLAAGATLAYVRLTGGRRTG